MGESEWWRIPGVPRPVYVFRGRRRRLLTIASAILILLIILVTFINVFSTELAILLTSILLFSQIIEAIIGIRNREPGRLEKKAARSIIESLRGMILAWSIPSRSILAAAKLHGNKLLYIYTQSGRTWVLLVEPQVMKPAPPPRLSGISIKEIRLGRMRKRVVVAPNPEMPRMWFSIICSSIYRAPASTVTPHQIQELARQSSIGRGV